MYKSYIYIYVYICYDYHCYYSEGAGLGRVLSDRAPQKKSPRQKHTIRNIGFRSTKSGAG